MSVAAADVTTQSWHHWNMLALAELERAIRESWSLDTSG
jgi:hypothetical protein